MRKLSDFSKAEKIIKRAQEEEEKTRNVKIEEYNSAVKELLGSIQSIIPEVDMISFSPNFHFNRHAMTFYIGQHNEVSAYADGEGNVKSVGVSGYERKVENANEVAELKLAYLLISGQMDRILKEKFPKIIQMISELSK